jgi:hypothetical protein
MPKHVIPAWLVSQYNYANKQGWIPYFREAAAKYGFTTEDVLGVSSRESNLKNIKGDYHDGVYHGFSLMQLDINSHKAFIESGQWQDVHKAILKGTEALAEKRDVIVKASKQSVCTIKFRSGKTAKFTPKPFNDAQLRQMTLAAYNCGLAAYYHFSIGNDIDAGTTGKNYSRDVLDRSRDFVDLMAKDAFGATANDRVVQLADHPEAENTPRPGEQNSWDFDGLKRKYDGHADLLEKPTVKSVGTKAGTMLLGKIGVIWETTGGKVALVLTCVAVATTASYVVYKYRAEIATFIAQLKAWVMK